MCVCECVSEWRLTGVLCAAFSLRVRIHEDGGSFPIDAALTSRVHIPLLPHHLTTLSCGGRPRQGGRGQYVPGKTCLRWQVKAGREGAVRTRQDLS